MRYDVIFIVAGLICVLCGMGFGIWMGVQADFTYAPAHAHLNLVGWVTLTLYGLIHRAYPALAAAKLAGVQMLLAILGAASVPFGIIQAISSSHEAPVAAIVSSIVVIVAALLFTIMFVGKAALAKP